MPTLSGSRPDAPAGATLVFESELPLRSRRFTFGFMRDAGRLNRLLTQMLSDPDSGLVSYELRADPIRNHYMTTSTWTSSDALARFSAHPTHVAMMQRHRDRLGSPTFRTRGVDQNGSPAASS